jgi:hypothetical protein
MKRIIFVLMLAISVSAPAFASDHVVARTGKVVGKDTIKTADKVAHGGESVVKFLF